MAFLAITMFAIPTRATVTPVKIGMIVPTATEGGVEFIQGAIMAKEELVTIGGRPIEIVSVDETQGQADASAETGTLAMQQLMAAGCDFVIGGTRTEAVQAEEEIAMDNHKIFILVYAATDNLIDEGPPSSTVPVYPKNVRNNYNRYKYMFRLMTNTSQLGKAVFGMVGYTAQKLQKIYGSPTYYAVVIEDLAWAASTATILSNVPVSPGGPGYLNYVLYLYGLNPTLAPMMSLVPGQLFKVSPTATNLDPVLSAIRAGSGGVKAQMIITWMSAPDDGRAFSYSWHSLDVRAIPVGINAEEQLFASWNDTSGAVQGETLTSGIGTNTPLVYGVTVEWMQRYYARWGKYPMTAWGSYNAINLLKQSSDKIGGSTDEDQMVCAMETTDAVNVLGRFKFTGPSLTGSAGAYKYAPLLTGANTYATPQLAMDAFLAAYNNTCNNTPGLSLSINPNGTGTCHDNYAPDYLSTSAAGGWGRILAVQWQNVRISDGAEEVVIPIDRSYSVKWRISNAMYPLWETDIGGGTGGGADGLISGPDMAVVVAAWLKTAGSAGFNVVADMDSNGIIDIADAARIGKDWSRSYTLPYNPYA